MTLGLTYQTSRESITGSPWWHTETAARGRNCQYTAGCHLCGFGASSLDITVNYFIDRTTLAEYNEVKEAINFKIMELCEKLGAEFAYPTQTLFVEQSELNNGQQAGRRESNV